MHEKESNMNMHMHTATPHDNPKRLNDAGVVGIRISSYPPILAYLLSAFHSLWIVESSI